MDVGDQDPREVAQPFERSLLGRLFIIIGPVGLFFAISLGLWAGYDGVRFAARVHAETLWRPGETLGLRVKVSSPTDEVPRLERALASVERAGLRHDLGELAVVSNAVAQTSFEVPAFTPGPATLELELELGEDVVREAIPVEIAHARPPKRGIEPGATGRPRGDNTDPQLDAIKIDVRPDGRLLAGFDAGVFVRVLQPDGAPAVADVEVGLVRGSFGEHHGDASKPPIIARGPVDALGLMRIGGRLGSDVLELEVRVKGSTPHRRRVRLVSDPGAVALRPDTPAVAPGDVLVFEAGTLTQTRPVYVDVFGPDGAFAATVTPPIAPGGGVRSLRMHPDDVGVVQLQASHFTGRPSEMTAVARVEVARDRTDLAALIGLARERLDVPRGERGFDPKLERAYLETLRQRARDPERVAMERRFLLGTLPPLLHHAPLAHDGVASLETRRAAASAVWRERVRWMLLGGGGVYFLALLIAMMLVQRRQARRTLAALLHDAPPEEQVAARRHVARAQRQAWGRALVLVAVMAGALWLTLIMLESLLVTR